MKKVSLFVLVFIGFFLFAGEIYLRKCWGFCDAILMQADPDFEYIAQPDQQRCRFKKHIRYNKYSQRSESVDSSAFIILGLGDSVINGGTLTDQDSLATTRLSGNLSGLGGKVQVLNISAGSWGPDNCDAYLDKYGLFGAKMAFLICSSHDAHDNIDHRPVVGIHLDYPVSQYMSAYGELFHRYLYPRYLSPFFTSFSRKETSSSSSEIKKDGRIFNTGFQALASRFRAANIPFFIWLNPEQSELRAGEYNEEGKEIIRFCRDNSIPLIEGLRYMESSDYRDMIHLNEQGQKRVADVLKNYIINWLIENKIQYI